MKFLLTSILIFISYLVFGVFLSRVQYSKESLEVSNSRAKVNYDYSGVLNVHSKKSSGSGSVQEIITAAKDARLDFIIFNETNPINQKQPLPIKYGFLNVYYGFELNYKNSRFLYASDEQEKVFTSFSEIELFLSNFLYADREGFLVLARPLKPGYEWSASEPPRSRVGVEVLNLREVWRNAWQNHKANFLFALLFYPFNPDLFFVSIYNDEALATDLWLEWSKEKRTAGYLGSDASSRLRLSKNKSLNFPSYENIFSMAKNHVLLPDELLGFGDTQKILKALGKGRSYFSIDIFGSPKGFDFRAQLKNFEFKGMGEEISFSKVMNLQVKLPPFQKKMPIKVLLYRNNKVIREVQWKELNTFKIKEAGVYRVEVRVKPLFPLIRSQDWVPWILSNPLFIRP